ncbi:MAG: insulinase family protein [Proteobacteria bacterium]|nr:insulinase family protein [Pseudomonadota bacterium]
MGAIANASTRADVTTYETIVAKEHLDAAMALESARLVDPLSAIDANQVALSSATVESERDQRGFSWTLEPSFRAGLFPAGHPYADTGRDIQLTLDDLARLADRYNHCTATITVIGDITAKAVQAAIEAAVDPAVLYPPRRPGRGSMSRCTRPPEDDIAPPLAANEDVGSVA